jgi:hypothetical protein
MREEMMHVVSYEKVDEGKRKKSRCVIQIKDECETLRTCQDCLNVKVFKEKDEKTNEKTCYLDIKSSSCWDFQELISNVPTDLHLHWKEWIQMNGTTHNSSFLSLYDIYSSQEFDYCKPEDSICETCRQENQVCYGLNGCVCSATCEEMAAKMMVSKCSNVSKAFIKDEFPSSSSIIRIKKTDSVKNTWLLIVLIIIAMLLVAILVGGFFLWRKYCRDQKLQLQQQLHQQQQGECTTGNNNERVGDDDEDTITTLPFARPVQCHQVLSSNSINNSSSLSSFFQWCCEHFQFSKKKKQEEEKQHEIPYANLQLFAPSAPHMDDVL